MKVSILSYSTIGITISQIIFPGKNAETRRRLHEVNLLLDFIAAHRQTLFAEIRAFRSMDIVRLPANERKNFERLLNLFIGTAVRETRALALKQVDLARTVEGLDAGAQQRVIEFYSI